MYCNRNGFIQFMEFSLVDLLHKSLIHSLSSPRAGFSSVFTRFLGYRVHDSANPVWIRSGRQWKEISVTETETVAQLQAGS